MKTAFEWWDESCPGDGTTGDEVIRLFREIQLDALKWAESLIVIDGNPENPKREILKKMLELNAGN